MLINKEINKKNIRNAEEYIEKIKLKKYFEEIPHTPNYENWAFKKYGKDLMIIK